MIKYYKVMRNGWGEDFISIEEKDLEKAIYAKLSGKVLLAGGMIDGSKIEMIVPDYHKTMGYNYGYKLEPADYSEIKSRAGDMHKSIEIFGERVKFLVSKGHENLIGTNAVIPELAKPKEISEMSAGIAKKFSVNGK